MRVAGAGAGAGAAVLVCIVQKLLIDGAKTAVLVLVLVRSKTFEATKTKGTIPINSPPGMRCTNDAIDPVRTLRGCYVLSLSVQRHI